MIRIASIPETIDLAPFSRWLDTQQVIHEIISTEGHQELFVEGEHLREPVTRALERYMDDPRFRTDASATGQQQAPRRRVHRSFPATGRPGPGMRWLRSPDCCCRYRRLDYRLWRA